MTGRIKVSRRRALQAASIGIASAATPASGSGAPGALRADRLRVEWRDAPIGVDTLRPRFTWEAAARDRDARGLAQSAWRIRVSSSRSGRGDVWDSGRIDSSRPAAQPPAPLSLQPHHDYLWTVELWDQEGRSCGRSAPARFVTALLDPSQWQAEWIAAGADRPRGSHSRGNDRSPAAAPEPLPIFRRALDLPARPRRAILSIAALGHGDVTINGAPVTASMLNPGWTDYRRTILYTSHDITRLLKPGANMIGVMLGNGMYNVERTAGRYVKFVDSFGRPKLIARLDVELANGRSIALVSNGDWQVCEGPIRYSNIFGGEDVDARLDLPGWNKPGAVTRGWRAATPVLGPGGTLRAQGIPGIEVERTLRPIKVTSLANGRFVYDFGENCSARPRAVLRGSAGSRVRLWPGEAIGQDGSVSQRSFNASPRNATYFEYTLAGRGAESFQPRFLYHGFRYLEAELSAAEGHAAPRIESLEIDFVHAALPQVGSFDSSEKLFVETHKLIDQALRSNMASVLTDCPHREKLGWLEQTHLNAPTILYNRDAAALYEKMAADIADAQQPDGMVPGIAPEYIAFLDKDGGDTIWRNSPEWGVAAVLSPWAAYRAYGDRTVLDIGYPAMRRYMDYLRGRAVDGVIDFGMGDWYDLGPKPPGESQLTSRALAGTACWYESLRALIQIAHVIGRPAAEAERWAAEAARVRTAFNRRFFRADRASYDTGSQCALAMPLALGMVPEEREAAVLANLVAAVRANGNGVTAGDVGFRYVIDALTGNGRDDVVDAMMRVTDRPGYGQQLANGATALAEAWDANPTKSLNHFMLGHGEGWLYGALAGLHVDFAARDPRRILTIAPRPVGAARAAGARHRTVCGELSGRWQKQGDRLVLEAVIPPGPGGTVIVPTKAPERVTESGKPVQGTRVREGLEVAISSGRYRFEALI